MRTIRTLAAVGAILLLCPVTTGSVFGQGGRSGGHGMGGSHHRPGGGSGMSGYGRGLGLVNPSGARGYIGSGYGYGGGFGGGYGGGFGAWFPGYPNDPYAYETGRIPTPPYFAIHPPVYYGRRVGMPYGNSTVTRPPRAVVDVHPAVQQVAHVIQPAMIMNPYAGEVSEVAESSSSAEPPEVAQDQTVAADQPAVDKQQRRKTKRAQKAAKSSRSKRKARKSKK